MVDLHITFAAAAQQADLLKDYGVPIGSVVLGALLGYIPSRLLASRASKEMLERDGKARQDADMRASRQVFVKLDILVNAINDYHHQTEAMVTKAEHDGYGHMPIWQRLSTYPGGRFGKAAVFRGIGTRDLHSRKTGRLCR